MLDIIVQNIYTMILLLYIIRNNINNIAEFLYIKLTVVST